MVKAARSSRWIHFSVDSSVRVFDYIKKCGCTASQWFIDDNIIKGYLFFPTTRPIPRQKQWVPGATYTFSTQVDVKSLYDAVPIDNWYNYGSPVLFEAVPQVVSQVVTLSFTPSPSELVIDDSGSSSDNEPIHLQPFALDVAGTRISKATVNLLLMPEFMQVDMVARLDFGQRSLFDVECQYVLAHYDAYMIALLAAQRDSS